MNTRGLVIATLLFAGCSAAGGSAPASAVSSSSAAASSDTASCPTPVGTPGPTLASTTESASTAPAGAIPIKMTITDAGPRYEPDQVSAKAGTVVFMLSNVPRSSSEAPDHMMQIGDCISFYGDGSIRAGEALAATPHVAANQAVAFTVNGLAPGTYVFWCSVEQPAGGNHAANGMLGTLTITP